MGEWIRRWRERSQEDSARLDEIAAAARWPRERDRTFGVVASVYQGVVEGVRLWAGDGRFRRVAGDDVEAVRGFGRGLVAGVG